MKILVACEESQAVTIELRKLGHEAYSNDIIECSGGHPEWHIQQDTLQLINPLCKRFDLQSGGSYFSDYKWDMIIAFPPCTFLSNSGARWMYKSKIDAHLKPWEREPHPNYPYRRHQQALGAEFFMAIANADCQNIAIENPMNVMGSIYRKKDQVIQPYEFGDPHKKNNMVMA